MTTIEERVRRGAAVLDKHVPDWEFRIRPERVTSIWIPQFCLLNEVFGDYNKGVRVLFGSRDGVGFSYQHGFCTAYDAEDQATVDAWQALIAERRKAGPRVAKPEPVLLPVLTL